MNHSGYLFVIDGDHGFVEYAGEQRFSVFADSFISMTKRMYESVCTGAKEFNSSKSECLNPKQQSSSEWSLRQLCCL
jgi:hypothetical protein